MNNPLVTIGIPVYNMESTVQRSLFSILSQTYKNLEIIISENASTDNTREIVDNIANSDSRIRVYHQASTISASLNFEFVLFKASGDYFKWHAADDLLDSDCINKYIHSFQPSSLTKNLIFSDYTSFDWSNNKANTKVILPILSKTPVRASSEYFRKPTPSAYYGLYNLRCLHSLVNKLDIMEHPFDWCDVFLVTLYIKNYGALFVNTKAPLYSAGYTKRYVPKPIEKFVNPFPLTLKILKEYSPLNLNILIGILRITIISLYLNLKNSASS